MINKDILHSISPFPFVTMNQEFFDGYLVKQPQYCCKQCKSRDCISSEVIREKHYICSKGFSCYAISYDDESYYFNGLIVTQLNNVIKRGKRKIYSENVIRDEFIVAFISRLHELDVSIIQVVSNSINNSISFLHDVKTSLGLVLNSAQEIIQDQKGDTFDQKVENADTKLRNLFYAVNLLNDQLQFIDVVANPDRISYGRKRRTAIYKLFHKMIRLFQQRGVKRNINIKLHGYSINEINAYESIQFLPLILLDNAVKYSLEGRDIIVEIKDIQESIHVKVSSYGPVVQLEHWEKIFEKYFRSNNASYFSSQGIGLGLYLAQEIAKAHNFKIHYEGTNYETRDNMSIGRNDFFFQIPGSTNNES